MCFMPSESKKILNEKILHLPQSENPSENFSSSSFIDPKHKSFPFLLRQTEEIEAQFFSIITLKERKSLFKRN